MSTRNSMYSPTTDIDTDELIGSTSEELTSYLAARFKKDKLHTRIGPRCIVALRPIRASPIDTLSKTYATQARDLVTKQNLQAHVFNVAATAYLHCTRGGADQSIVVMGESGSGKSQTTKSILRNLCDLSKTSDKKSRVHSQLLKVETVLAAFGNATTPHNADASCFVGYTEVQFKGGRMVGAKFIEYALEKSRVTQSIDHGRTFHIFYYMLEGLSSEEKVGLHLSDAAHFSYLAGSNIAGFAQGNGSYFETLRSNLKALGIGRRQQSQLWQLLAAILHLGNLQFTDCLSERNTCSVKNTAQLQLVAEMLGTSLSALQTVLTSRSRVVGRDNVVEFLNAKDAVIQRDYFARCLYSTCFSFIIEQINLKMCAVETDWEHFVSILEVPGFAGVGNGLNGYHRFLVNYANERLYSYVNEEIHMNELLREEGLLELKDGYSSNREILDVLDQKKIGVIQMIGKDFVDRVYQEHSDSGVLVQSSSKNISHAFGIHHYGGVVEYDTTNFEVLDRDTLQSDFIVLIRGSPSNLGTSNQFLRGLFSDKFVSTKQVGRVLLATPITRTPSLRRRKVLVDDDDVNLDLKSNSLLFKSDFQGLLDTLIDPLLVFCINPLSLSKLNLMTLKRQIEMFDLKSLINHPSTLYTFNYLFDEFMKRYESVISVNERSGRSGCVTVVRVMGWSRKDAQVGSSRIFLSQNAYLTLEAKLITLSLESSSKDKVLEEEEESVYESEFDEEEKPRDIESGVPIVLKQSVKLVEPVKEKSSLRKKWLCCTWATTFCFPSFCLKYIGGMKQSERQLAWREKFALCVIIFFMNVAVLFVIVGTGYVICPKRNVLSPGEVSGLYNVDSKASVYMYGRYFTIPDVVSRHISNYMPQAYASNDYWSSEVLGHDVTYMFPKQAFAIASGYCKIAVPASYKLVPDVPNTSPWVAHGLNTASKRDFYTETLQYAKGGIVIDKGYINNILATNAQARYMIINDKVYDLSSFYDPSLNPSQLNAFFLGAYFKNAADFYTKGSSVGDATSAFNALKAQDLLQYNNVMQCLDNLFFIGGVDHRNDLVCVIPNYILLAFSIILVSVIGFKFVAALQFPGHKQPEDHDKFVICQVPCYTEGEVSLMRTINSLSNLGYDDKHKLLFIICDGMVIGAGNDRPTPRIVLDILGVDPMNDPESFPYQALGDDNDQLNMAKVYSGLYEHNGHTVPYIVVVKVGKQSERRKPGNRGKRDSQLILMRFLSRVHFNQAMTPLELDMFHHMKNIIGVDPSFYEYVFMVDADTMVNVDSLNYLVSHMTRDAKIAGTCGETSIANDKKSFTSMIQVYEYFISHHLSKAFESLFGSVTCLPGCFCMYRIRTPNKNVPVLIAPGLIKDYSENTVDTLHLKNLLHLGEDRYLTTLTMKHFPNMKTTFCVDAKCQTYAPDKWPVLLSQRRRWINSTVHNLFELLRLGELCGFCCLSMRFVVFIDLLATFIQPSSLMYIGYLVYLSATNNLTNVPVISLILIAAVYGFQIIIFLLKTQWQHIGWMFFYILGVPLFGLYIPMYSFWHFDDFSWGNTRMAVEEEEALTDMKTESFDPASVPLLKWTDLNSSSSDKYGVGTSIMTSVYAESNSGSIKSHKSDSIINGPFVPLPSDEELLMEIKHILSTTDLMKITKKTVRDRLSRFFGVDVSVKKEYIHACIDGVLKGDL